MEKRGEGWRTIIAAGWMALACVCSIVGLASMLLLAPRIDRPVPTAPLGTSPLSSANGLIAYVGTDGNIYAITPDGRHKQAITQDQPADPGQYNTLAWSQDGRLAFTTVTEEGSALLATRPGEQPQRVYSGKPGEEPFYLCWSPDGQRIAFLTWSPPSRIALWLAESRRDDSAQTIARGASLYFSWSPQDQSLLMHIGGAQSDSLDARIAIFQPEPLDTIELSDAPGSFQAPAWSPGGERFLLVRENEHGEDELVLAEGNDRRVLASSRTGMAFTWSPLGNRIAFARPRSRDSLLYESVIVLDPDRKVQQVVARGNIVAFFWSPDGEQLAVLSLDESNLQPQGRGGPAKSPVTLAPQSFSVRLVWSVTHLVNEWSVDAASFRPTDPFLSLIPYFGQYAQSLAVWSPDSRFLVFADLDERERPAIRVLDTRQPYQPAQQLAEGTFAVWSWR